MPPCLTQKIMAKKSSYQKLKNQHLLKSHNFFRLMEMYCVRHFNNAPVKPLPTRSSRARQRIAARTFKCLTVRSTVMPATLA